METSHLTCAANQMTGFFMKCNTGMFGLSPEMNGNKQQIKC